MQGAVSGEHSAAVRITIFPVSEYLQLHRRNKWTLKKIGGEIHKTERVVKKGCKTTRALGFGTTSACVLMSE